jgi:hypothetical protein
LTQKINSQGSKRAYVSVFEVKEGVGLIRLNRPDEAMQLP